VRDAPEILVTTRAELRAWLGEHYRPHKGILQWIASAKRPETRSKRVAETAELASRGLKANQWPR